MSSIHDLHISLSQAPPHLPSGRVVGRTNGLSIVMLRYKTDRQLTPPATGVKLASDH